jgi:hypothetical protein
MNPTKKTFIVSSLILSGILWYDYAYIISGIIELIFQKTHHYFVPGIFSTDILLIGFIPFWIYLGYKWKPSKRRILVISITSLLSLLSVIIIAAILCVKFGGDGSSPLLPKYLIYDIFPFYWSTAFVLGISIGILPFKPWRKTHNSLLKSNAVEEGIIDN